ncbi:GYD domain-containing protein [Actinomadura sp. NPDC048032]|uniref:GYD domain-containing protein n=1 Tax=Actinomadura sp. NPDC048032 TaxID=3155747 RepID=UPI003402BFCC
MALAVVLAEWTDQGNRTFWDTVDRSMEGRKFGDDFGIEFKEIIWTPSGPYDLVIILEGPSLDRIAAFMLLQQSLGSIRAVWMPGYKAEQMDAIITSLSGEVGAAGENPSSQ